MLKIRLARVGKKKHPTYRLVISESARDMYGKALEILGHFNPFTKVIEVKKDRILYWISKGAQLSPTVHNMLIDQNVIIGDKVRASKGKKKKKKGEEEEPLASTDASQGGESKKPAEAKPSEDKKPEEKKKPEEVKEEVKKEDKPVEEAKPEEPKKEEKPKEVKEEPKKEEPKAKDKDKEEKSAKEVKPEEPKKE